ncbi:MAG: adenosylcobalamin-dependent ribonucleoside-diphosphate reductase [Nanoarchaeota archaeon]|nr:adenosylcobalamin-dependent ribonucleoside-diphosphate reductase [Nanoarchaeota archaeon]
MLSKVRKKGGKLENFDKKKIESSIRKTTNEIKEKDKSSVITKEVVEFLERKFIHVVPSTEDIQDIIEDVLIKKGMTKLAKAYILHNSKMGDLNHLKNLFGPEDSLGLSLNATTVLQKRYLKRDNRGKIIETPEQMFNRVAKYVASVEKVKYKKEWESAFFNVMKNLDFLPNTPCLANAGTNRKQLFACYVLDMPDSMDGIFESLKKSAKIFQSGGGVGYSFSNLRSEGSLIATTNRIASGPISFMQVFDQAAEAIKKGGIRKAAMMGVLDIDHMDVLKFINSKEKGGLENFNISVAVTEDFMNKVVKNKDYWLKDNNGKKVHKVNAQDVFNYICSHAWENGDPGLIFIDEVNRKHTMNKLGKIQATNPCGEVDLLPNEACCLGSVNLSHMIKNNSVDWVKLSNTVKVGVRFLDNVVSVNEYPSKETKDLCLANRKIGLGVMGWADMLVALSMPYDSDKSIKLAKEVMKFIKNTAEKESENLSREKGFFKNINKSKLKKNRRNATLLSIAPTGSISIIANCSSGIEPLFGVAYVRKVLSGVEMFEMNKAFEYISRYQGFYSKELMIKIAKRGSIQDMKEVPNNIQQLFKTSLDVPLESHIKMQAAFQEYVDNGVSKTVNLVNEATIGDVRRAYMLAWKQKCKGITVYRYGSRDSQVLYLGEHLKQVGDKNLHTKVNLEYSGGHIYKNCEY